jgi:FMN-dependent NADH-azoreductase
MADILHISGSPKREHSVSIEVAEAFLVAYRANHPDDHVRTLNVFETELPDFGAIESSAKFAPIEGRAQTQEERAAWAGIKAMIESVSAADKIVVSCPMWNFHVPWRVKLLFDVLVQPGLTFGLNAQFEHVGLLDDRPLQFILSRSSTLIGDEHDHQLPWLREIWAFIGITDPSVLIVAPTTLPPDQRPAMVEKFCAEARAAAESF